LKRRLRQLAERSDYFRSELRSMHHQTWFLPNDQAFSGIGSSLSFLLDQSYINNTNEINEVKISVIIIFSYVFLINNYLVYQITCYSISTFSNYNGFNKTSSNIKSK